MYLKAVGVCNYVSEGMGVCNYVFERYRCMQLCI